MSTTQQTMHRTTSRTDAPASFRPAGPADALLRPARPADIAGIVALIGVFAGEGLMLPRSAESVALMLEDFVVVADRRGGLLACGALRSYSPSLAEISSLAVAREAQRGGMGAAVVRALERMARSREIGELFALTLTPRFFAALGYEVVDRARYPEKLGRDCSVCALRQGCREICVARTVAPDARLVRPQRPDSAAATVTGDSR